MIGDTVTSICNRALAAVGTRSTIASLTEGSNEANNCALIYDPARMQLLRAANWNFANSMETLSLLLAQPGTPENPTIPTNPAWVKGQQPPLPWLYEMAYPQDCIRVHRVTGQFLPAFTGGIPLFSVPLGTGWGGWGQGYYKFKVATDQDQYGNPRTVILTDIQNALVIYTQNMANTAVFDPLFTEALVNALAGQLALALTGDKSLAKLRFDAANEIIIRARVADGDEGLTVNDRYPDWIQTRGWVGNWQMVGQFSEPFGPLFPAAF